MAGRRVCLFISEEGAINRLNNLLSFLFLMSGLVALRGRFISAGFLGFWTVIVLGHYSPDFVFDMLFSLDLIRMRFLGYFFFLSFKLYLSLDADLFSQVFISSCTVLIGLTL